MRTIGMSILTVMAMTGCGGPTGTATLSFASDVSVFDGRTEHAVLTLRAVAANGQPGTGVVTLVATVGSFVGGPQATLVDGLATATYVCNPVEDPACNGQLQLGASWGGLNERLGVRVTPSEVVGQVRWKAVPTLTLSELNAMAVGAGGRLWAVGSSGAAVALSGSLWSQVLTGTFADLLAVSFTSAGEGVIVGRQGTFLIERAGVLEPVETHLEVDFTAVLASSVTDVVIGARDGTLYQFDGATLTKASSLGVSVVSLTANGARVWAGGEGALAVRDSGTWGAATLPVETRLNIAASSPEGLWLGGPRLTASGSVLMLGPSDWRTFDLAEPMTGLAVVPDSSERFVISLGSVWRQVGVGTPFAQIDAPMGGNAVASRGVGDLVVVGPPGLSIIRY